MTYRGKVKDGVVVIEGDEKPAEGTEVSIVVDSAGPTIWKKLLDIAGTAKDLPPDASKNIDHYLYGAPKR